MKKTTKSLLTSLVLAGVMAMGLGTATTVDAAYRLNSEVKNATPALEEASSIGVRVHNNAALKSLPNKDAIVITSFGTTFKETREKTIDATAKEIQAAHPNTKVIVAFTSHIIRDRILEKEGIDYPTPESALEKLKAEGYTRVTLTNFNIIPGLEYKYSNAVFNQYKNDFKTMTLGLPLMYWMGQEEQRDDVVQTLEALATQFPKVSTKDAILILAHGTPDPSNAYYAVMQDRINTSTHQNTFIYTVEGTPNLETVIPQLKAKSIEHVTLMPLMMVAGDHANNDMAGDEPDSHKSILMKEGFKVDTYIHGLGENEQIRKIFVERATEAIQALDAKPIEKAEK